MTLATDLIVIISSKDRGLTHLFLSIGLLLSLGLGTLLPLALVTGLSAGVTQPPVGSLLALGHGVALDLGDGLLNSRVGDGQDGADTGGDTLTLAVGQSGLDGLDLLGG